MPYKNHDKFLQGLKQIEFKQASEPSDIIWENRQVTKKERNKRCAIVFLVIGFALLVSFHIIFICTKFQFSVSNKFKEVTECEKFVQTYKDELEEFAILEFKNNEKRTQKGKQAKYGGTLQCFCKKQEAEG